MLEKIISLITLWKSVPVLLSYFGLYQQTKETDINGNDWTGAPGQAPGITVVKPDNTHAAIAAFLSFWSFRSLFR